MRIQILYIYGEIKNLNLNKGFLTEVEGVGPKSVTLKDRQKIDAIYVKK